MKYLILITTVASYFVLPHQTLAAEFPANVFISEVNWAGSTSSNADEWLELTNPADASVDLTGWSIEGAATNNGTLKLLDSSAIAPHSTYLISNYDASHSTLAVTPDFVTTAVALSNSGLRLVLHDGSSTQIDSVGDGGSPAFGSATGGLNGIVSMIRGNDGWISATSGSGFDAGIVQYGTPGSLDITFAQTATAASTVPSVETVPLDLPATVEPAPEPVAPTEFTEAPKAIVASEPAVDVQPVEQSHVETSAPKPPTQPEAVVQTDVPATQQQIPVVVVPLVVLTTPKETPQTYSPGVLVLNEIMSDPLSGNEWVEIYNPSTQTIPLDNWRVKEGGGQSVGFSGMIAPSEFASVEFVSRLNNDGDRVQLLDPSGQVIDAVSYGGWADAVAPAAKKPNALARDPNGTWLVTTEPTRNDTNSIAPVVTETKTVETKKEKVEKNKIESIAVTVTATNTPTTLRIIDVLANPVGSDDNEYIVIENIGDVLVELNGWMIADAKTHYALVGSLAAGLKLTLPKSITHITLNNDADSLTLTAPNGAIISTLSYENAQEGIPYASIDRTTQSRTVSDTQIKLARAGSTKTVDSPAADSSAADVKRTTKKKSTTSSRTAEGVVIAAPNTLGSQIMYIDGMQLYQYRGDFPTLALGDVVRASGVMSNVNGESRLKIARAESLTIIGNKTPESHDLKIADLSNGSIGHLVRVIGVVTSRGTDRFKLEENGSSVSVVLKDGTGLSINALSPGEKYEITGVLSRQNDTLRLLPRVTEDLMHIASTPVEQPTSSLVVPHTSWPWGLILVAITTVGLAGLAWRHQKKTLKPIFA